MTRWWCVSCDVRWDGDVMTCWCCGGVGLLGVHEHAHGGSHEYVHTATMVYIGGIPMIVGDEDTPLLGDDHDG